MNTIIILNFVEGQTDIYEIPYGADSEDFLIGKGYNLDSIQYMITDGFIINDHR